MTIMLWKRSYRIFSKNSSHLVSQKFRLTTEFRVVFPTMRKADETLELSDEYLESGRNNRVRLLYVPIMI